MTEIAIQPSSSCTGTFTIAAPNSNTNRTFTLPDATGEVLTDAENNPAKLFRRDNILGTVSQSGGVPTGAVIERGSNANGEFVKYADGTMICWTPHSLGYTLSGLTAGSSDEWTFPATFSGNGVYSARGDADGVRNSGLVPWPGSRGRTFDLRFRTAEDVSTNPLSLYAIGRWF